MIFLPLPTLRALSCCFVLPLAQLRPNGHRTHSLQAGEFNRFHPDRELHQLLLRVQANNVLLQAASAIDSFKIESPVKKINFNPADKENQPLDESALESLAKEMDNHKPAETVKKVEKEAAKPVVAPTIKPEEIDEPILQENPQRFVLFPIKYHEVCSGHAPPRTRLDA